MRLEGVSRDLFAPCQAVIVLVDPEKGQHPPEALLRSLFGLTPAEARLATLLGGGHSLTVAAERIGVAKATARTQLKAIFEKTQARRQAELVALLQRCKETAAEN
jgi:DNA-binding CsgD family transcriptional regulator